MWLEDYLINLVLLEISQRLCERIVQLRKSDIDESFKFVFVPEQRCKGILKDCSYRTSTKLDVRVPVVGFGCAERYLSVMNP